MARLLILGGSNCQCNAFRRAKERGIETVLFDYLPHPPAAALADRHEMVSTFDWAACLARAEKIRPDGVMTMGTDQPVYTAAYLARHLHLPSALTPRQALAVTNKALMKRILSAHALPTMPYRLVDADALAQWPLPGDVVIKPLDSQGQKGVFRAGSGQEAARLFANSVQFSRCRKLLCEEYYPSNEVTVSAWVHDGKATTLTVTDRITFPHQRHIGVCAAHRYPSVYAAGKLEEVEALTERITAAFAIPAGPLYIQLLLGERGMVVNELACRIGGAFEDVFIPAVTGFDILDAVMDAALGITPPRPPIRKGWAGRVRVLMPFARAGTLAAITPLADVQALSFVLDAGYNFSVGDTLPVFENAGARLGYAVLAAADEAEMQRCLQQFFSMFYARNPQGEDLLLPFPPLQGSETAQHWGAD